MRVYTDLEEVRNVTAILAFTSASGQDSAPICTINYAGFDAAIGGMIVDTNGNLWALDSGTAALVAFPRGSNGVVSPTQIISGDKTDLQPFAEAGFENIAVDGSGNIWVPQIVGNGTYIVAFHNDSNGNVRPFKTIGLHDLGVGEDLEEAAALAFDSQGNLYVGEYIPYKVVVFSPPFKDTSQPVASWNSPVDGYDSQCISVDARDNVYVGGHGSVVVYNGGLTSKGLASYVLDPPSDHGFIGVAVGQNDLFATLYGSGPFAIAINPLRAKNFDHARYIKSNDFVASPVSIAVGR